MQFILGKTVFKLYTTDFICNYRKKNDINLLLLIIQNFAHINSGFDVKKQLKFIHFQPMGKSSV